MQSIIGIKRRLLCQSEAAARIGIDRKTLRQWLRDDVGPPSILLGKRRYFTKRMIDQWVRTRSVVA